MVVWTVWASWLLTVIIMTTGALFVYISSLRAYLYEDLSLASLILSSATLMYNPVYGVCTAITTTHVQTALPAIQAVFVLILTFFTVAKAYQFPSRLRGLKDVSQVVRTCPALRGLTDYFLP